MCEAGLHISLGVGLRLYNLLVQDCQGLDLQLALLSDEVEDEVTQSAIQLLNYAQSLEKDVSDLAEGIEQHQAVHDFWSATLSAESEDVGQPSAEHQLQHLAEYITSLQRDAAGKVLQCTFFIDSTELDELKTQDSTAITCACKSSVAPK